MKLKYKFLVVALLLSLTFSLSAAGAAENVPFEQSESESVLQTSEMQENSNENLNTPSYSSSENEERGGGKSKSLNNNDDDNSSFENTQKDSLLGAGNDENLLNAPSNMDLLKANDNSLNVEMNDNILGLSKNNGVLGAQDNGTFTALQKKIENANDGETIVLENNYTREDGIDGFRREGILVSKPITIDGNGYTLDAKLSGRIFQVTAPNVTFKNINFVKGRYIPNNYQAGAISWEGANGTVDNCSFAHCRGTTGAAIVWYADYGVLGNSTFTNCSVGGGHAGAVYWGGNYGVLGNCTFTACDTSHCGDAVYWGGNYGVLGNCTFTNCGLNSPEASAVHWNGANGVLGNCTFTKCKISVIWAGDIGTLYNSNFTNAPRSRGAGGAVKWRADYGVLRNCTFYGLSTHQSGGAVFWSGNYGVLDNSTFVNCRVHFDSGGAVLWNGVNGSLGNCNFVECYSGENYLEGGAVYWNGVNGTIYNSSFVKCSATKGGAILWNGVKGSLINCIFNNTASQEGGAVYWKNGVNGSLINCIFNNTVSKEGSGGAVYWNGVNGYLDNSTFVDCLARIGSKNVVFGGAVYWNSAGGVLSNSIFTNCSTLGTYYPQCLGGGVYWNGVNGSLINSSFENCRAYHAGAVYWSGVNGILGNSSFENCRALWDGGAVYWNGTNGTLSDSNFTNNSARYGGAAFWTGVNGILSDSNFTNNSASMYSGGAVLWTGVNGTLSDSNFTNNSANTVGGAIALAGTGSLSIDVAYFNYNRATKGSSIYKTASSNLVITNTEFGRNRANSNKIDIKVEDNETFEPANVIVKVSFNANDNIANAIWNDGNISTVKLANITCEFSYDGTGREYKTFNKYAAPEAITSNQYVKGSDELWQNSLENAQLLDINITDKDGDVIYSIVNGTETIKSNARRNLLKAFLPTDAKPVNVTDVQGMISIKLSNLKAGTYRINAEHKSDDYYTGASNSNSFSVKVPPFKINKTVDNPTPVVGEVIKYNLTVVNTGSVTVRENLTLVDSLPDGLEYADSHVLSGADLVNFTVNGKELKWVVTNIASTTPLLITVDINVTKAGTWTNNLTLNNMFTVNETVTTVDPNKTVDDPNPVVGQIVKYNLTVVNTGTDTIRNEVTLVDTLSDGLDYVDHVLVGADLVSFTRDGKVLTWVVTNIATGAPLVVTVSVNVTKAGTWINNLTVGNKDYTVNVTTIVPDKTVDDPNPVVGQIVKYNLTVVNTGTDTIRNEVTLVDTLSDGLDYVDHVLVGADLVSFTRDGKVLTWVVTNIATGAPLVVTVSVNVTKAGTWINNLTVGNKDYTVNVTTIVPDKTVDDPNPVVGQIVKYNLTVVNTGTDTIRNEVTLVDTLSDGLDYVDHVLVGADLVSFTRDGKVLTWVVTNIATGAPLVVTVSVNVTKAGTWINNLTVGNKDYTVNVTTIVPDKTVDNPTPVVGQIVKYNLTVVNTGTDTIRNEVTLVDTLSDGLDYVDHVLVGADLVSFTRDGKVLTWVVTNIATGAPLVVTVDVNVTKAGTWINNLTVGNKDYTVNVTTVDPDKTVDNPNPVVGQIVKYNLTVVNTGTDTIRNEVTLVDTLSDGLDYVDHVLVGADLVSFTRDGKVLTWVVTNIATGAPLVVTVDVNVTKAGTWINNLTVGNKDYTVNVTTVDPDKTVDDPNPVVGQIVKYNLTVVNTGTDTIRNEVTLVDTLSDGLEYAGNYALVGGDLVSFTRDGKVLTWVVTNITKSVPLVVTVSVNVTKAGTWINNLTVGNKDYTVNVTTVDPNKTVDDPNPVVGQIVKYNLTVVNTGSVTITKNMTLVDSLPDGLEYAGSFVYSGGKVLSFTQNGKVLTWIVTDISTTVPMVITVDVRVTKDGTWTNNLTLNNGFTVNQTVNTVVPNKTVDNPNPVVGEVIKFNLTVVNTGSVTITKNITIIDTLPDGLEYAGSYSISGGKVLSFTQNGKVLTWIVSDITTTAPMIITVDVKVTKDGTWTNNLTLNNGFTVSQNITTVVPNKTVDNPNPVVGEVIRFNLTVVNTADITITKNITIIDTLPDGLEYAGSYSISGGKVLSFTQNGKVLTWIVSDITTTAPMIITVDVKVTKDGTWTNNLTLNNGFTVSQNITTVVPNKTVDNPTPVVGEVIRFNLTVVNTGDMTITKNITLVDTLPDGLEYAGSYSISGGKVLSFTQNGNVLTWIVTDITTTAPMVITVDVKVTKAGTWTNNLTLNNGFTVNQTVTAVDDVYSFDISKITLTPNVNVGDQVIFEIVVVNTGNVKLTNFFVEETYFDDEIDYVSWMLNDDWTYSFVNAKHRWTLNKVLNPGEVVDLFVIFNANSDGVFKNIVTGGADNALNKTAENITVVSKNPVPYQNSTETPSLDISKVALEKVIVVNNQVVFEIVVHNTGDVMLSDVIVSENPQDGLKFVRWYDNSALWRYNGDLTWTLNGILYPGEYATFYVVFDALKAGDMTNYVGVVSNATPVKYANDSVKVVVPSLSVEKIALNKTVVTGDKVMFEIIVSNDGSAVLNNVKVREDAFNGLRYNSFVDYSGSWVFNNDMTWTYKNPLNPGDSASFIVVFDTLSEGKFINIVVANSSEGPNKFANASVDVFDISVDAQKITLTPVVIVGEQALFEIRVQNTGVVPLSVLKLTEYSFDGLIYDHYIDYSNIWINDALSWILNTTLLPGDVASLYVVFNTTRAGNFTNIVLVNNDVPANNNVLSAKNLEEGFFIEAPVEVIQPEFSVEKITLNKTVRVGDKVMFEIVVKNTGSAVLNNVKVKEDTFTGLKYNSFVDNSGNWVFNNDMTWTYKNPINPGESASFIVVFDTSDVGEFVNVITAEAKEVPKVSAMNTTRVNPKNLVLSPSLSVEKIALNKSVTVGDKVMFEIVVRNTGDVDLNDVFVIESYDSGLVYGSFYSTKGLWRDLLNNEGKLQFNLIDTLKVGESASFIVVFDTSDVGVKSNTVLAGFNNTVRVNAFNETEVIKKVTPVIDDPVIDNQVTPDEPVNNESQKPQNADVEVLPETGNPLIMVLLALFALGLTRFRKKD